MKFFKFLMFAAFVGALTWGGKLAYDHYSKPAKSKRSDRVVEAAVGPVELIIESTGAVVPMNRVEIKPPIQGRVEELLVEEGDEVKTGQIIAWMSSVDRAAILDAARAKGMDEYKRWQEVYKPTPIVSPISGVVILRNVVAGQTVDPSTILYAMSDELIVIAQVDESDVGRIHDDMPVHITLDAYPDRAVEGKVFDILHEGKNVSNVIQYGVKIKPDSIPPFFRSQMTANVSFVASKKADALLIPTAAVQQEANGSKYVLLPHRGAEPKKQEIQTGIEYGDQTEILSGLSAGDKVLLRARRYVPQKGPETSPLTGQQRPQGQGQGARPNRRNP